MVALEHLQHSRPMLLLGDHEVGDQAVGREAGRIPRPPLATATPADFDEMSGPAAPREVLKDGDKR